MKTPFTKEEIAKGNDQLRQNIAHYASMPNSSNRVMITRGVAESQHLQRVLKCVKYYTDFNPNNDPWGEHDFGSFEIDGKKFFFKIDYFDMHFQGGVDPYQEMPHRVLTMMLAEEY